MLRKGHGGLYNASTRKKKESERLKGDTDQIKTIGSIRWTNSSQDGKWGIHLTSYTLRDVAIITLQRDLPAGHKMENAI